MTAREQQLERQLDELRSLNARLIRAVNAFAWKQRLAQEEGVRSLAYDAAFDLAAATGELVDEVEAIAA